MAQTDLINEGLLADYHDKLMNTHIAGGCVFDISAYHATGTPPVLATYADLAAALGTNGANIPEPLRKGGMSVKFIQSSDNNYVQYFLTAQAFTVDVKYWLRQVEELKVASIPLVNNAIKKIYIDTSGYTGSVDITGGLKITRLFNNNNGKYGVRLANNDGTVIEDWTELSTTHIVRKRLGLFAYIELDYSLIPVGATEVDAKLLADAYLEFNDIRPNIIDAAFSETYKITSITRNGDGDVSSLNITYLDGGTGTLTLTRNSSGDITHIAGTYNQYSYAIGVVRNSDGDVETVVINK